MSTLTLERPGPEESAASYHGYIAAVPGEKIGSYLPEQLAELDRLTGGLDEKTARARYAPGKWSVNEVLGHLADAERIFGYRLLRIGRGDATPLPGFDENSYVPAGMFDARPVASVVGELRAVRLCTIALVQGLPMRAWTRGGQASGAAISARALAYIIVGHMAHHFGVLRDRYGLERSAAAAV